MKNGISTNKLPPVYTKVFRHEMFPELTHDETARYNFIANLNQHLSEISTGNRVAYEKRVQPAFKKEHGRDFKNRHEVRHALKKDLYYQAWSALRRNTMEMRQQAGRSIVLRQINTLNEKADKLNEGKSTLQLNPEIKSPRYASVVDIHCQVGGYHTELCEGDVSVGANYDTGIFVTTTGGVGPTIDGGGKALAAAVKQTFPDFNPKRILDIGCTIGHNVLPIAQMYPDAEIVAVDVGAPVLRYGHARAQSFGVNNVTFLQADVENLDFEDESFDWIQTTMFLHETSSRSIRNIMNEVYRMLKPGGLCLHVEQPQYTPDMDLCEQALRDWDCFYNNEPFWSTMHGMDSKEIMTAAGFTGEDYIELQAAAQTVEGDVTKPAKELSEDHGREAMWTVFGGWKQ
jgi:ubiquinone/menaquinone biosynthesis C-methylase UbiE|tara:strand:- start:23650 stop:24852 length:1203 start_codon:yes stop_codon:yes gene_type:complete